MNRTVCVVTGSRADYGLLAPVIRALRDDPDLNLRLVVSGMHLAPEFGQTWRRIEEDGFAIDWKVDMLVASDTPVAVGKSVGLGVIGFAEAFAALAPGMVLLLGDRFETLAAAQAALFACIPVAHIAGGDLTEGVYDEAMRHAITKMAHLHFVTNAEAGRRVRQLGEAPERVHVVGSPGLDALRETALLDRDALAQAVHFPWREKNLLITFHPPTLHPGAAADQCRELLTALEGLGPGVGLLFTLPNADNEGRALMELLRAFATEHQNARVYASLGHRVYLSAMAQADAVVGNSSSGLYEAPSLGVPTVNIGDRQQGRLCAASVIDCPPRAGAIRAAVLRALGTDARETKNPYGDGHSAPRIVACLKAVEDWPALVRKRFVDWTEPS